MTSNFSAAPKLALYVQSCCTQSADSGTMCVSTPVPKVLPGIFLPSVPLEGWVLLVGSDLTTRTKRSRGPQTCHCCCGQRRPAVVGVKTYLQNCLKLFKAASA